MCAKSEMTRALPDVRKKREVWHFFRLGENGFHNFVASSTRRSIETDRWDARFPFPCTIKATEKNPLGGRGLDEYNKESLSIRALAIFTFPERTCHTHTHMRARAVLEGAGRCTRTQSMDRGRDTESRGDGREVAASGKRDAMGRGGGVGNAAGGEGTESRKIQVAPWHTCIYHVHRPSSACAGDASPSMHRSRGCALVTRENGWRETVETVQPNPARFEASTCLETVRPRFVNG